MSHSRVSVLAAKIRELTERLLKEVIINDGKSEHKKESRRHKNEDLR